MRTGTKSILFGAHAFWFHPWFVALAWWELYGFPFDPRLWIAFFVHDLGYWGKEKMDDVEGESHPWPGALLIHSWIDSGHRWQHLHEFGEGLSRIERRHHIFQRGSRQQVLADFLKVPTGRWTDLCLYHSRFLAKRYGQPPSRLCAADKLAFSLTPKWLYLLMASASGEIREYMSDAADPEGKYSDAAIDVSTKSHWWNTTAAHMRTWAYTHQ